MNIELDNTGTVYYIDNLNYAIKLFDDSGTKEEGEALLVTLIRDLGNVTLGELVPIQKALVTNLLATYLYAARLLRTSIKDIEIVG